MDAGHSVIIIFILFSKYVYFDMFFSLNCRKYSTMNVTLKSVNTVHNTQLFLGILSNKKVTVGNGEIAWGDFSFNYNVLNSVLLFSFRDISVYNCIGVFKVAPCKLFCMFERVCIT